MIACWREWRGVRTGISLFDFARGLPIGRRRTTRGTSWLVPGLVVLVAVLWLGTGYRELELDAALHEQTAALPADDEALGRERTRLARQQAALERKLQAAHPHGPYIVVDQTHNRLYLERGDRVVHEATCSAGSGLVLRERGGERTWVFDTPCGRFTVLSKLVNPMWRKPDWAFIEEGRPLPVRQADRFEAGVLGEYALYFGDGYMIHGTLYERLLGRSVTHGCVRLGRNDLRKVYAAAAIGTPICIF